MNNLFSTQDLNPDKKELDLIQKITDEAIEKGYENAHVQWRGMALGYVMQVCKEKEEFTVNDVRRLVEKSPLKTHDNRAMGGVMVTAKKLGWLKASGRSIPSKVGHKVPIQIWQSLIYKGNA